MSKKRKHSVSDFAKCIDPRFCGGFNLNTNSDKEKGINSTEGVLESSEYGYGKTNDSTGFQNFIHSKLAEYLDKHIKEVDRPVLKDSFFSNKLEHIHLFTNSDLISEEQATESVPKKPKKKKHKKDRNERELFKEVAVSYEFIQRQAQLLNS